MTAQPGGAPGRARPRPTACARQLTIHPAPERVFGASATLDGVRRWWTAIPRPLSAAAWPCMAHTRDGKWIGSTVRFGLADRGPQARKLDF